jgi:hypothetical protein
LGIAVAIGDDQSPGRPLVNASWCGTAIRRRRSGEPGGRFAFITTWRFGIGRCCNPLVPNTRSMLEAGLGSEDDAAVADSQELRALAGSVMR